MVMEIVVDSKEDQIEGKNLKGVKYLHENGATNVPNKYILPHKERPRLAMRSNKTNTINTLKLPIIDLSQLFTGEHGQVIESLDLALREYGFFQVINHGVSRECVDRMASVSKQFFELPFDERAKYMLSDIKAPVRYGTSFNQMNDKVFYWRDFLKLLCHPLDRYLPYWPSTPMELREATISYSKSMKILFMIIMELILDALNVVKEKDSIFDELSLGSHLLVVNCYPPCPQPELTLGMPPHSDYGFLTLLLQDDVEGLQVKHKGEWVNVEPMKNAIVVNAGDHLEIFSNGRYKSVLHRVLVNSSQSRMSIASLHSVSVENTVRPASELVNEENPALYMDTNIATFLNYISLCEAKEKGFLETRKLENSSNSQ